MKKKKTKEQRKMDREIVERYHQKLTEDFEMQLHIFSWDNYDYEEDHPVKVTFK